MIDVNYISHFFSPLKDELVPSDWFLNDCFVFTDKNLLIPDEINKFELFFLSIDLLSENEETSSFIELRKNFYQLSHPQGAKFCDLGNILTKENLKSRKIALKEIIEIFSNENKTLIVFSNNQEPVNLYFSVLEHRNKKAEIAKIDSSIDYFENTHLTKYGLLGKWMLKKKLFSHFSALATQEYYVQTAEKEFLEDNSFTEIRLGQIKQNSRIIEPSLREADGIIFSIHAIESCAAPAQQKASPNGLNSYEACNVANFIGLSNSGKIILFTDYFENIDIQGKTAALMAQMLWYFLKASAQRVVEFPEEDSSQFTRFIINQSHRNMNIAYFQSKISNRWWIEVKLGNKIKIYPCLKEEYEAALQNEIPDEWIFYLKKMELS